MKREINITITDATGNQFEFSTLKQLNDFCKKENDYWASANENNKENLILNQRFTKTNHLQAIINTIETWKDSEPTWEESTFNAHFQDLKNQQLSNLSGDWIWHGHAFVPIWIELYDKSQNMADAFISTVLNRQPNNLTETIEHFKGHILGYEFLMQDESELTKRRNSEKKSIAQLRNQLFEKNNELINSVEEFKDGIETWNTSKRKEVERLYKVRQKLGERQIKNHERRFTRELDEWRNTVSNLENTYEEALRLRKPADYWKKAAKRYGRQGALFTILLIVFGTVSLLFLADFFTAWLEGKERAISLSTLQGAIIFGSLIAIFAFLIKVFSRLAFSSFHLMRDAEEREQLTYLYLSLSEETSVEEDARFIILQALFSRTETGLLNQEHGPTMPTVSEAMKYAPKKKTE
ncbi:MAG: DUF6161 domain-containing protein [Proteobacteria bacterium]|nr:DUF6161 domain-containing protein [Pseudomonadota bacterium]